MSVIKQRFLFFVNYSSGPSLECRGAEKEEGGLFCLPDAEGADSTL